ncbi:MAG: glycosyltransferase family 2 protein [bacterium]
MENNAQKEENIEISIIVPVFNEEGNLREFHRELSEVISGLGKKYEVVYIDDGSVDQSRNILKEIAKSDPRAKVILFTRNFGQTSAISAGFQLSTGRIIIPMDADLQNDPHDIPRFLEKIDEGFDVVSGWRRSRKDTIAKKLPSRIANLIISKIGGLKLHDYGCSMKAYRREIIQHVRLYGEMHRFIPLYAHQVGASTTEIEVNHRERASGRSNYGFTRIYKVLLDLITTKFMGNYMTKPIYFFGSMGFILEFVGAFFAAFSLYDRYINGVYVHRNPKLLVAVFLLILGFQFIMLGILAELLVRIYYESQQKQPYFIKDKMNFIDEL